MYHSMISLIIIVTIPILNNINKFLISYSINLKKLYKIRLFNLLVNNNFNKHIKFLLLEPPLIALINNNKAKIHNKLTNH